MYICINALSPISPIVNTGRYYPRQMTADAISYVEVPYYKGPYTCTYALTHFLLSCP